MREPRDAASVAAGERVVDRLEVRPDGSPECEFGLDPLGNRHLLRRPVEPSGDVPGWRRGVYTACPGHTTPVLSLVVAFAVFGGLFGVWQVLLPDLKLSLDLSDGQLGAMLTTGFLATFPAMWLASRKVEAVGTHKVIMATGAVLSLSFVAFWMLPAVGLLTILLLVFFGASGAYDIAINRAAIDLERHLRRQILTRLHAAFSLGAAAGAVVAGSIRATAPDPFPAAYLVVPPAVLLAMALIGRRGVVASPARSLHDTGAAPAHLRATPLVLLLSAVTLAATLSEGALETWSAIYLRLALAMPVAVGVLGVVAFHAAMGVGRLGSGRVIERFGRRATLAAAGLLVAVAMPLTLAMSEPVPTVVGLLFVAIGLSVMFPIGISLAGDRDRGGSGAVASAVIGVAYAGFLIGPALIGGIAELASLRVALLTVAVAGLVAITVAVIGLGPRGRARPAGQGTG